MFWSARENLGGVGHFCMALERCLLMRKRDHYINALLKHYAETAVPLELKPLKNHRGESLNCRFCGYGIASFTVQTSSGNYDLSCCSTQVKEYLRKSAKLSLFLQDMPSCRSAALTALEPK